MSLLSLKQLIAERLFGIIGYLTSDEGGDYMLVKSEPDTLTKLTQMGDVTLYEPAGERPQNEHRLMDCISYVATPKGPKPVMKTMVTTACERNCYYCPFRAGRSKMERNSFKPDQLASAFDTLQRSRQVDGLFLSSGIVRGSMTTQDSIIKTAEIIRHRYQYDGYVHLKVMPGIEYDQLYRTMQLADRVSVNLEGPTQRRLEALAPKKDFLDELVKMLRWIDQIRRDNPHQKLASSTTQFVVGAVGDTDLELLSVSEKLYRDMGLSRAYYMGFRPVSDTPFEALPAINMLRQNRLYQASFLLRDYDWNVEELPFLSDGNLPTHIDPKRAWADQYLRPAPIDLMTADRLQLMRVPGIGKVHANAILRARQQVRLRDLSQLRKLGLRGVAAMTPYILLDGRRPPTQLSLFT